MSREFSRSRRVGEQIQRELAQLIQREVKDPRLGMVTVSAVEVSRDLSHAKVYISTLGEDSEIEQSMAILKKVAGFLRHELGLRMKLRVVPELRFVYDSSIARGAKLSALIDQAVAKEKRDEEDA